jgi:hypothetical protein
MRRETPHPFRQWNDELELFLHLRLPFLLSSLLLGYFALS